MTLAPATQTQMQATYNLPTVDQRMKFRMPSEAEMNQINNFCLIMSKSPFYQKLGAGGVMAIYMTAWEYNLPIMACLNGGLHTFDGKVTFSALMINALILQAGHTADLVEINDQKCIIKFTRGDRKNDANYRPLVFEYTTEMAQKAGYLSKTNWKTSLRDMLYNRCLTGGGRKHMPEVFMGVLVAGELVGDNSDQFVDPILPTEVALTISSQTESNSPPVQQPILTVITHEPAPKVDGFDEFVSKHSLALNTEGKPVSRKMEFVLESCKRTNMSERSMLNSMAKNQDLFETRFNLWEKKNYPEPSPIDEVVEFSEEKCEF